jgi:hypothetical protein
MKIIQVTEGVEVVNPTSSALIKQIVLSPTSLQEEVVKLPRPWPHDGVVRSWSY